MNTIEEVIENQKLVRQQTVRQAIDRAADQRTREGIIADVLAVTMVGLAKVTLAVAEGKALADIKTAVEPIVPIAKAVLEAIDSGALKLPYMVKAGGIDGVLADMIQLSNGVSAVLADAKDS